MASLYLTLRLLLNLGSVCLLLVVTTQKINAYSPWTSCCIKSSLQSINSGCLKNQENSFAVLILKHNILSIVI